MFIVHWVGEGRKEGCQNYFKLCPPKERNIGKIFQEKLNFEMKPSTLQQKNWGTKRLNSQQKKKKKMTTEISTFKSYSVVLTSFWQQVTSVSHFRGHRTISLYSDSSSVCPYDLGLRLWWPAIPRTNVTEISSRRVFQASLDKTPTRISWQTRLSGKDQKPQLLNIRKGER